MLEEEEKRCIQCNDNSSANYIELNCKHLVCPKCLLTLLKVNSFRGLLEKEKIFLICNCSKKEKNSIRIEELQVLFQKEYGEFSEEENFGELNTIKETFIAKMRNDYSVKKERIKDAIDQLNQLLKEHREKYERFQTNSKILFELIKYMLYNKNCEITSLDFISKIDKEFNTLLETIAFLRGKKKDLSAKICLISKKEETFQAKLEYFISIDDTFNSLFKNKSETDLRKDIQTVTAYDCLRKIIRHDYINVEKNVCTAEFHAIRKDPTVTQVIKYETESSTQSDPWTLDMQNFQPFSFLYQKPDIYKDFKVDKHQIYFEPKEKKIPVETKNTLPQESDKTNQKANDNVDKGTSDKTNKNADDITDKGTSDKANKNPNDITDKGTSDKTNKNANDDIDKSNNDKTNQNDNDDIDQITNDKTVLNINDKIVLNTKDEINIPEKEQKVFQEKDDTDTNSESKRLPDNSIQPQSDVEIESKKVGEGDEKEVEKKEGKKSKKEGKNVNKKEEKPIATPQGLNEIKKISASAKSLLALNTANASIKVQLKNQRESKTKSSSLVKKLKTFSPRDKVTHDKSKTDRTTSKEESKFKTSLEHSSILKQTSGDLSLTKETELKKNKEKPANASNPTEKRIHENVTRKPKVSFSKQSVSPTKKNALKRLDTKVSTSKGKNCKIITLKNNQKTMLKKESVSKKKTRNSDLKDGCFFDSYNLEEKVKELSKELSKDSSKRSLAKGKSSKFGKKYSSEQEILYFLSPKEEPKSRNLEINEVSSFTFSNFKVIGSTKPVFKHLSKASQPGLSVLAAHKKPLRHPKKAVLSSSSFCFQFVSLPQKFKRKAKRSSSTNEPQKIDFSNIPEKFFNFPDTGVYKSSRKLYFPNLEKMQKNIQFCKVVEENSFMFYPAYASSKKKTGLNNPKPITQNYTLKKESFRFSFPPAKPLTERRKKSTTKKELKICASPRDQRAKTSLFIDNSETLPSQFMDTSVLSLLSPSKDTSSLCKSPMPSKKVITSPVLTKAVKYSPSRKSLSKHLNRCKTNATNFSVRSNTSETEQKQPQKINPLKQIRYASSLSILSETVTILPQAETLELPTTGIKFLGRISPTEFVACSYQSNVISVFSFSSSQKPEYILKGHTQPVCVVIPLMDENLLASGSCDSTIIIWDKKERGVKKVMEDSQKYEIKAMVQISPKYLASSSFWNVKIWDLEFYQHKYNLVGHSKEITQIIKLNENIIVSASVDCSMRIWDLVKREEVVKVYGSKGIYALVHIVKNKFAFGADDFSVIVFSSYTRRELATLKGHTDVVLNLEVFGKDRLISNGKDGNVILWDLNNFTEISRLKSDFGNEVNCILGSKEYKKGDKKNVDILLGMKDGTIHEIDGKNL